MNTVNTQQNTRQTDDPCTNATKHTTNTPYMSLATDDGCFHRWMPLKLASIVVGQTGDRLQELWHGRKMIGRDEPRGCCWQLMAYTMTGYKRLRSCSNGRVAKRGEHGVITAEITSRTATMLHWRHQYVCCVHLSILKDWTLRSLSSVWLRQHRSIRYDNLGIWVKGYMRPHRDSHTFTCIDRL